MPASLSSESEYAFICDCHESMRSACEGEIFYAAHNGARYCVLHFPGGKSKFWEALDRKLDRNDLDFRGLWFPGPWSFEHVHFARDANFDSANFEGEVDFTGASFSGNADFSGATFKSGAYFSEVNFKSVSFSRASFHGSTQFNFSTFADAASFQYCKFQSGGGFAKATFEKEVDFHGVTFSQETHCDFVTPLDCANFRGATFRGRVEFGVAEFNGVARFNEVVFEGVVDLSNSVFGGLADFSSATFSSVAFMHCVFKSNADFRYTTLKGLTQFERASFDAELDFSDATVAARVIFRNASFRDHVKFSGNENKAVFTDTSSWVLQFARIEKPDHFSFHTLNLRPHWFVNVDARKFDFTNVNWDWRSIDEEIRSLQRTRVLWPHRMLSIACRHLAVNAEENHRYEETSKFRYMAMDVRRIEWVDKLPGNWLAAQWKVLRKTLPRLRRSLRRDWGVQGRTITRSKRFVRIYGKNLNLLYWLYWMVSGYGERITRASAVLLGIWFISAVLYTFVDFRPSEPGLVTEKTVSGPQRDLLGAPLTFGRALAYSAGVMTLQRPEPRPATTKAQTVVILETILGPVQAALLALAIRRRFMR